MLEGLCHDLSKLKAANHSYIFMSKAFQSNILCPINRDYTALGCDEEHVTIKIPKNELQHE